MLAPAIVEARVIPYGVDVSCFCPAEWQTVRTFLGISSDTRVLLFTAHGIQRNMWKDYRTMRTAVTLVAKRLRQPVLFIALGDRAPTEHIGQARIHFVPYQENPEAVARYYQAADVYMHAARADTFPMTILEALACGTPVVATAVGGIPEQIKALQGMEWTTKLDLHGASLFSPEEATGILVPPGDEEAMAAGLQRLLDNEPLRLQLGHNAARDARQRFDLERQAQDYLAWYRHLLDLQDSKIMVAG